MIYDNTSDPRQLRDGVEGGRSVWCSLVDEW